MIPYIIVFFICLLFSLLDFFVKSNILKYIMIFTFGIIIIVFAGIRWQIGTDWENYSTAFYTIQSIGFGKSGFEFFFELLLRTSIYFSGGFTLFLFLNAIIIFLSTSYTLIKYSPFPLFSLLLLLSYSFNSSGFGYRQDIAISICFFSAYFIFERKLLLFILSVFIATLFHQSAIIFLPAYWVSKFVWNKMTIIYLILLVITFYYLISKIGYISSIYSETAAYKVAYYSELSQEEISMGYEDPTTLLIRGLINRFFIIFLPLIVLFNQKTKDIYFLKIFNILFFGFVLFILLSPLGYVFWRFTRYYELFQILLIPIAISFLKPNIKYAMIAFYIIYCIFKFSFVLILESDLYIPYNTIFNLR